MVHGLIRPIDLPGTSRRDHDLFPDPPVPSIDDGASNAPIFVSHADVLETPDLPVFGTDIITGHGGNAADMRITLASPGAQIRSKAAPSIPIGAAAAFLCNVINFAQLGALHAPIL